jgi:hypothetical protein
VAIPGRKRQGQNVKGNAASSTLETIRPAGHKAIEEHAAMSLRSCTAVLAVILSVTAGRAATDACPAKSTAMDDVIAALNEARGCDAAMKVFQACEYGASGDVQFGAAVEKKCEADFLAHLKAPEKLSYQRAMRTCDRKYRNESGTMYLSFTAFCRAQVAQRYSRRVLKAQRSSR